MRCLKNKIFQSQKSSSALIIINTSPSIGLPSRWDPGDKFRGGAKDAGASWAVGRMRGWVRYHSDFLTWVRLYQKQNGCLRNKLVVSKTRPVVSKTRSVVSKTTCRSRCLKNLKNQVPCLKNPWVAGWRKNGIFSKQCPRSSKRNAESWDSNGRRIKTTQTFWESYFWKCRNFFSSTLKARMHRNASEMKTTNPKNK